MTQAPVAPGAKTRPHARPRAMAGCALAGFAVVAIALATGLSAPDAFAAGPTAAYTVGNYPVEARAKDAVTAKTTAIGDGQQAALRSLFRRLVPVTAYKRLTAMPPLNASDFIDGVSVRQERNSSTEYIASLDFSFQPTAVRDALRRNGIPYVDEQAPQVMLVPVWRETPAAAPESGKGLWFDAWKGLDLTHTLAPLRLEGLKPGLSLDALKPLLEGSAGNNRLLAGEYRTETVVIALAEPDASGKKLTVTLAGQDAIGPFTLKRSYRIGANDRAYTAELAAVVGLGVLEGRWKAAKAGAIGGVDVTAGGGSIRLQVEFQSLSEWNDIRTRLLDADGAYDMDISSVSARAAEVTIRHAGGTSALSAALARSGLSMTEASGSWLVRQTF